MSITEPKTRLWTVAEFRRAAEVGLFEPEERQELVDGEIIQMTAQNGPHIVGVRLALTALEEVFRHGWVVLPRAPLTLEERSAPEPDVAVVRGDVRDLTAGPASTAALVVEVADTALAFDRGRKAKLYARSGIAEYWIVDLPDRVLELYRDPDPEEYRNTSQHPAGGLVSPLAAPDARVAVRDLLP